MDCPNNPADSRNGRGAVPYIYQIGKFDITVKQYCAFLNAVARYGDPFGLYDVIWMTQDPLVFEIERKVSERKWGADFWRRHYIYTPREGRGRLPIVGINFYRAIRFCNWMENNQPDEGEENERTTEDGSYLITGGIYFSQREHAHWVIMTWDEWYKAAYYNREDPANYWDYATQSNEAPGNSADPKDNQPDSSQKNVNYCLNGKPSIPSPFMNDPSCADLTPIGCFEFSPGPFGSYDMTGNATQLVTLYEHDIKYVGGSRYDGMRWGQVVMSNRINALSNGSCLCRCNMNYDFRNCTAGFRLTYLDKPEEVPSSQRSYLYNTEKK